MKPKLKEKAIKLRKKGLSYNQILRQIPVAKSTLSLWLRPIGLSNKQKQRLTQKKLESARRGAQKMRKKRLDETKRIISKAKSEVNRISKTELWLMGVMLYWAEGSKEKPYVAGARVSFSNSDPIMIKLFLKWLNKSVRIKTDRITFDIYIHENNKNRINQIKKFWASVTGFSIQKFDKIYFKKHNINTKRKNINKDYFGLLKINIKSSTNFNRQIQGWIIGISEKCGVV